ncbi:MAG: hypothetical protein EOQ55_00810 [Mesorhizobium sp.]|uniref:winged helix domain-containing protein n=1 Tax=Mesorhizobium sp. TaxID=1871066 RepID=UPI000FE844C0|nr:hypothetical protein [Mesorhizobium sp.]RWG23329.1 MAG: hypothetical protein EOQ55_00810 [Mesorhizobium sp.]RWG60474.1 MAG: hypothetical protein EOQ64_01465 [Mesorhizobium sp.]RWH46505.1 MAG: hypothetical protein EOQ78_03240 [Mesorhizobium sp.]
MNRIPDATSRVNSQSQTPPNKFSITVRIEPDGTPTRLEGRVGWALQQLVDAGKGGCTPVTHPGPRWSDYVFKARALGFVIETVHESHGGQFPGHHARYVLHSDVSIVSEETAA